MAAKQAEEARAAERAARQKEAKARAATAGGSGGEAAAAAAAGGSGGGGGSSGGAASGTAKPAGESRQQGGVRGARQQGRMHVRMLTPLRARTQHLAGTPAAAVAQSKVAAVEHAATGLAGSGGAVRVPVAHKATAAAGAEDEGAAAKAADREAAQKRAEKEAEADKRCVEQLAGIACTLLGCAR